MNNQKNENIAKACSPSICEDTREKLEEISKFNVECEAKEVLANESIIEIKEDLRKSGKENKRNFIITLIISILTLLVATATFIFSFIK